MAPEKKPAVSPTAAEFGTRLRVARIQCGLTQEAAAALAGVHSTIWGKAERGAIPNPGLSQILRYAAAVGRTPGYLLDGLPIPEQDPDDRRRGPRTTS